MLARIRRSGNSFVIRIPREELARLGVAAGEYVTVEIRPVEVRPRLAADLRAAVETEIALSGAAFDRLANA